MPDPEPLNPQFSVENDIIEHIDSYGVDILPPVEIMKETTRAQNYFAELSRRWPHLFQSLSLGSVSGEFAISAVFHAPGRPQIQFQTFALTGRGPCFSFPRRLTVFELDNVIEHGLDLEDVFRGALEAFVRTFPVPARQIKRIGVVRNLTFQTGTMDCSQWLAYRMVDFGNANLQDASCFLAYVDDNFNIRIQLNPVQLHLATIIPGGVQSVVPQQRFGLQVILDVNNKNTPESGSLSDDEREDVLRRANEVFPNELIHFLNMRRMP